MTNWFVEVITSAARPAVAVIFAATIAHCVTQEITPPAWFLTMAGVAFAWYFGDRTMKHRAERKYDL